VRITFKFKYPIARTMAFEKEYHENLRLTLEEKRWFLKGAITIWMFDGNRLVGETYGVPLGEDRDMPPGCPRDREAIYCFPQIVFE